MAEFDVPDLSDASLRHKTGALAHQQTEPVYRLDVGLSHIKHEGFNGVDMPLDSVGNPDDLIEVMVSLPLWLVQVLDETSEGELLAHMGVDKGAEYKPRWVMGLLARSLPS